MNNTLSVCFDPGSMQRYDREGPRYTSYPSARQFHDRLAPGAYERAATGSRGAVSGSPLSLYAHLPFCRSPCFYCGCNKVVTHRAARIDVYVQHLLDEISLRSAFFQRGRVVEQLHFGGGTPTLLSHESLAALMERLAGEFHLTTDDNRDYSIEIDPRGADRALLALLANLGFNRISLGVQDFDEHVQRAVNRVQAPADVSAVYEDARRLGFKSVNFDLIYGLPLQTLQTFETTLERVISMRPDRLAVYGYAHMPQLFKAQRQIRSDDLPDVGTRLGLLELTVDKLCAAGYVYIGMDHFALPEDGLSRALANGSLHRSFQGYTTHADRDLVSVGVSAIGKVGDLYVQNFKSLPDYERTVARGALPTAQGVTMTHDDRVRQDVINRLMCRGFVDFAAVGRRHGVEFKSYFATELGELRRLAMDGLVDIADDGLALTPVGRLLMRNVAMVFDAYLGGTVRMPMSKVI